MPYVTEDDCNPATIRDVERSALSSALGNLAEGFEALVVNARESIWSDGSRATQWMQASDELPAPMDVGEVRLLIGHLFSRCFAAADHVRGAAAVVGRAGTQFSLATVSRGCIESLGKASYVLTATSAGDAIRKNLRLIRGELRYLGTYSEIDVAGTPIDADVVRNTIDQVFSRFGVTDTASVTQLAAALLDREAREPAGRPYYSHISSFAHAEVDSLNIFLSRGNLSKQSFPGLMRWSGRVCVSAHRSLLDRTSCSSSA